MLFRSRSGRGSDWGRPNADADHAVRWISLCQVTLGDENIKPVTLTLSLPGLDLRVPTVCVRTPEMVKRRKL